jgi:hypothetical protein
MNTRFWDLLEFAKDIAPSASMKRYRLLSKHITPERIKIIREYKNHFEFEIERHPGNGSFIQVWKLLGNGTIVLKEEKPVPGMILLWPITGKKKVGGFRSAAELWEKR